MRIKTCDGPPDLPSWMTIGLTKIYSQASSPNLQESVAAVSGDHPRQNRRRNHRGNSAGYAWVDSLSGRETWRCSESRPVAHHLLSHALARSGRGGGSLYRTAARWMLVLWLSAEPAEPRAGELQVRTCCSSCLSWPFLLRSWALRQTRGGSAIARSRPLSRQPAAKPQVLQNFTLQKVPVSPKAKAHRWQAFERTSRR
jgi:hypothetical protein